MEEMIDIFDSEGNKIDSKVSSKLDWVKDFHRVVLVIPKNSEGKLILSKRANKEPFPNTWVCAIGGKVAKDETPEEAAKREMMEEAGLDCKILKVGSVFYNEEDYNAKFYLFVTEDSVEIDDLVPEEREIQFFKDFTLGEIDEMIKEDVGQFANTFVRIFEELGDRF